MARKPVREPARPAQELNQLLLLQVRQLIAAVQVCIGHCDDLESQRVFLKFVKFELSLFLSLTEIGCLVERMEHSSIHPYSRVRLTLYKGNTPLPSARNVTYYFQSKMSAAIDLFTKLNWCFIFVIRHPQAGKVRSHKPARRQIKSVSPSGNIALCWLRSRKRKRTCDWWLKYWNRHQATVLADRARSRKHLQKSKSWKSLSSPLAGRWYVFMSAFWPSRTFEFWSFEHACVIRLISLSLIQRTMRQLWWARFVLLWWHLFGCYF